MHPQECLLKELWSHGGGKKGGWLCGRWGLGAEYINPVWGRLFGLHLNSKCLKMVQWRYVFALCVYMSESTAPEFPGILKCLGLLKLYQQVWSKLSFMCQSDFPNPRIGFRFGENSCGDWHVWQNLVSRLFFYIEPPLSAAVGSERANVPTCFLRSKSCVKVSMQQGSFWSPVCSLDVLRAVKMRCFSVSVSMVEQESFARDFLFFVFFF